MISDSETNYLFLADTLPKNYPDFYARFNNILRKCNVNPISLDKTKDVWVVDYMPIQIEVGEFAQFRYEPPYLTSTKKWRKTISDVDRICRDNLIDSTKSNIILDGGNVVKSKKKAIMTERVFKDNPQYEHKKLIEELYRILKAEHIFFIPEQPDDFTGHSDGMIRFVDDDLIIINDYKREKPEFFRAFELAIHNTGINHYRIPYNVYNNKSNDQANGNYINYMEMENCVIVPTFALTEDDEVVRQFEDIFAGKRIETIDSNEIANNGGVLNCITWNIKII